MTALVQMPLTETAPCESQRRFQRLVEPHLGPLLRFARRRTASVSDAEGAVQEACLRAWTSFATLRDEARMRSWLFRILRTVLSDAFERETRRDRLAGMAAFDEVPETALAGEDDAVFAEVMTRLSSEAVYDALAAIPEDFATAVEMHDIDGLKYHEIADSLDVPIGTVMSRISRGRRLLARAVMARPAISVVARPAPAAHRHPAECG